MSKLALAYTILVALAVLTFSSPLTQSSSALYQAGISDIFFETALQTHVDLQPFSLQFTLQYTTQFPTIPSAIASIAGFEASIQKQELSILSVDGLQPSNYKLKIKATKHGEIKSVQISYLIFDRTFENTYGIWFWKNQAQSTAVTKQPKQSQLKIRLKQIRLNQQTHILSEQVFQMDKQVDGEAQLRVMPILSSILWGKQSFGHLITVEYSKHTQMISVKVMYSELFEKNQLRLHFTLVFKEQDRPSYGVLQNSRVFMFQETMSSLKSNKVGAENQKMLLLGLNTIKLDQKAENLQLWFEAEQARLNSKHSRGNSSKVEVSMSILMLQQIKEWPQRLLTGCSSGTYNSSLNWTFNSLVSQPIIKCSVCPPISCKPCPLGCLTCETSTCNFSVSCTSCDYSKGYVPAQAICNSQFFCNCTGDLYPNPKTGACDTCVNVIPNCQICSTKYFIGTYCSTCTPGFYLAPVTIYMDNFYDYLKGGNPNDYYNRTCSACQVGCMICSNSTKCTKCFNNISLDDDNCKCDSSKGLFYNAATQSCTSCSTVIPGCTNCSRSGNTTFCSNCTSGFYYNSTTKTCVACSAYCTTCDATTCFNCNSSSFTKSGATCTCTVPYFLNSSATSPSCLACSKFQTNCQTCQNSTGVVLCSVCNSGYFSNAGVCTQCISYCTNCTNTTDCTVPYPLFFYNATSLACQCQTGYILKNNACVLCANLIPNCQICNALATDCNTCNPPFYPSSPSPVTCLRCPLECKNCTGPSNCEDCIDGYTLTGTVGSQTCVCKGCTTCPNNTGVANCTDCTGSSCSSCLPGSYFISVSPFCIVCPTACSFCTSNTTCLTCNNNYILSSKTCGCNNAIGEFFDPNYIATSSAPCKNCSLIYSGCTACNGTVTAESISATSCTACVTGTYLLNSTSCSTCPTHCTACSPGPVCTDCQATFQIINNICQCDTNSQYFLSLAGDCKFCGIQINNCIACEVNMTTPIQVGCATCATGYYNQPVNDSCTVCPSTCDTCNSPTDCLSCKDTYALIGGVCVCDAAQQLFDAGGFCAPCYSFVDYCTQCLDTSGTITCNICGTGTYLKNPTDTSCTLCGANCNTCDASGCTLTGCLPGFASVAGVCTFTNQCQNFVGADPNCVFCYTSNTSSTNCQACQPGYYVDNQLSCLACPSTCVTCSDYFTCLTCQPTFTLVNGVCQCDALTNQVLSGSTCVSCSSLFSNCSICSGNVIPVNCSTCLPTFYLNSTGSCVSCTFGCLTCLQNGSCSSCIPGFNLTGNACNNVNSCNTTSYYGPPCSNCPSSCNACPSNCSSCLSSTQCLICATTFTLINGQCICDTAHGMFFSSQNYQCNRCGAFTTGTYVGNYPPSCQTCTNSSVTAGFECLVCADGFYVSGGLCQSCQPGCSLCSGNTSCSACQGPIYVFSAGNCICNAAANYFLNVSACSPCNLTHCTICLSLSSCSFCSSGFFVNTTTTLCQAQVCGNGRLEGVQQCDDNNLLNGDGCSSTCAFQNYFICNNLIQGQMSVCLAQNNKFKLQATEQIASCNKLKIKLKNTGSESISSCNISKLLNYYQFQYTHLQSSSIEGEYVTYTFSYNHSIIGLSFNLVFDPTTLCIVNSDSFPPFNVSEVVNPTNNRPAVYYKQGQCRRKQSVKGLVDTIQYASYGILMLSALPCKIVGLQLFGVLQLAHLSLGSLNNINLMLEPLAGIGGVNGYRHDLGGDKKSRLLQTFTPERISAIDYNANFIRNCNAMLLVVLGIVAVAFVLYILTYIFKKCSPTFHKIAKRLIKEVLLTLILFNQLNFAYSAGIHFRYAPKEDPLYLMGSIAAAGTLIIPVLMSIALLCTQDEGFGQFKDKLKPGYVQRSYFVVTIVYRMGIGLYMSSGNEDELSTLLLLAFSLFFLLYNLVNLPFTKAYHNYRANICHFAQFVTLFVAMFYRSMKSTTDIEQSASIFTPVYFQYVFIFASLLVSMVVLIYEIYLFIKNCCCGQKQTNNHEAINKSQGNSIAQIDTLPEAFPVQKKEEIMEQVFDEYQ